jgi:hypothetical protein
LKDPTKFWIFGLKIYVPSGNPELIIYVPVAGLLCLSKLLSDGHVIAVVEDDVTDLKQNGIRLA